MQSSCEGSSVFSNDRSRVITTPRYPDIPRTPTQPSQPGSVATPITIPGRDASLYSRGQRTRASTRHGESKNTTPSKLLHAYFVCGLNSDPTLWSRLPSSDVRSDQSSLTEPGINLLPQILGSRPKAASSKHLARIYSAAARSCFPNSIELQISLVQPTTTSHSYVLQGRGRRELYGVCLIEWVKVDKARERGVLNLLKDADLSRRGARHIWMPYCLSFISEYPLFDLIGDCLRSMWKKWRRSPDKFNVDGVLTLMSISAPSPASCLRIATPHGIVSKNIPRDLHSIRDFALWPIFQCLSATNIVMVLETALSPHGRIIFISRHTAMLTIAAETIRHYVSEWKGLFVPVTYMQHFPKILEESGPYIVGITKQNSPAFASPADVLLVDLDYNAAFTSQTSGILSKSQRLTCEQRLSQSYGNGACISGVPDHLRTAYSPQLLFCTDQTGVHLNGKDAGLVTIPEWWNEDNTGAAIKYILQKVRRMNRILHPTITKGRKKSKALSQELTRVYQEHNQISRSLDDAWTDYMSLEERTTLQSKDMTQLNAKLQKEVRRRSKQFQELSDCTQDLITDITQLHKWAKEQGQEVESLTKRARAAESREGDLNVLVKELKFNSEQAEKALQLQQELVEELEKSRATEVRSIAVERDSAERALVHLSSLVSAQLSFISRTISPALSVKSVDLDDLKFQRPNSWNPSTFSNRASQLFGNSTLASPPATGGLQRTLSSKRQSSVSSARLLRSPSPSGLDNKTVTLINEIIHNINEQSRAVIEDIASKRENSSEDTRSVSQATIEEEKDDEDDFHTAPISSSTSSVEDELSRSPALYPEARTASQMTKISDVTEDTAVTDSTRDTLLSNKTRDTLLSNVTQDTALSDNIRDTLLSTGSKEE